jgi:hypothetical protein
MGAKENLEDVLARWDSERNDGTSSPDLEPDRPDQKPESGTSQVTQNFLTMDFERLLIRE